MKEDIELFLETEKSYNFFDLEIENVLIWKYIREDIYNLFLEREYKTERRVAITHNYLRKLQFYISQLRFLFSKNNCNIMKADLLFCNFPRKIKINGRYSCIQLEEIIKNCIHSKFVIEYPFWIEDNSYEKAHFNVEEKDIFFTDKMELQACIGSLLNGYKFLFFLYVNSIKIHQLIEVIEHELEIKINKRKLYKKLFFCCYYEKIMKTKVKRLLNKIKPKCFIEVYTPNRELAIFNEVCHELEIPIIDIQHGALNYYEPIMYSYSEKRQYLHLSDYIFLLGEYWKNKPNFHLKDEKLYVVGSPFLEYTKNEKMTRRKEFVLILSQTRYHKYFIELCEYLAENLNCKIVLKLHPYENAYYEKGEYKKIEEKGVKVVHGLETHLYNYLQSSMCVIGINSTALFEAIAFDVPVFFAQDKYGTETIQSLVKKFNVFEFKNNAEVLLLFEKIVHLNTSFETEDLFAAKSSENIKKAIDRILEAVIQR